MKIKAIIMLGIIYQACQADLFDYQNEKVSFGEKEKIELINRLSIVGTVAGISVLAVGIRNYYYVDSYTSEIQFLGVKSYLTYEEYPFRESGQIMILAGLPISIFCLYTSARTGKKLKRYNKLEVKLSGNQIKLALSF